MPRAPRGRGRGRARGRGTGTGRLSIPRPASSPSPSPVEEDPRPPFFDTTFSTHRVSPLHVGDQSGDDSFLRTLADRLRDTLIGDVVRGVYVGLEPGQSELGKAGSLESVSLRWVEMRYVLDKDDRDRRSPSMDLSSNALAGDERLGAYGTKRGIWIDIQYENAECTGMLLPDLSGEDERELPDQTWAAHGGKVDQTRFLQLPLLLLRMPPALKNIVIEWLASAFDCRISSLTLGTCSLVSILEKWLANAVMPSRGVGGKDIVLTLGFSLPQLQEPTPEDDDEEEQTNVPVGIRSMDVAISPGDVQKFLEAGEAMAQEREQTNPRPWTGDAKTRKWLAGGNDDDGWAWKTASEASQPFVDAVARYLDNHLALNLFHPCVKVIKVATPGFVLTESRVKVFGTEEAGAVRALLGHVTARSRGPELASVF
ncbi:hypothetical protein VUR80DRAFT_5016 [Thermomyces stellatus]